MSVRDNIRVLTRAVKLGSFCAAGWNMRLSAAVVSHRIGARMASWVMSAMWKNIGKPLRHLRSSGSTSTCFLCRLSRIVETQPFSRVELGR
jgi:hypothetical protein